MKTIKLRSYKESFLQKQLYDDQSSDSTGLIWQNGFFKTLLFGLQQPQIFVHLLLIILLYLSLDYRLALVLFLSLSTLLLLNYFYLKYLTDGLNLKVDPPKATTEKQMATLNYTVYNFSPFNIYSFILKFNFLGSIQHEYIIDSAEIISANSFFRNRTQLICNVGMGRYSIKDFTILISDPFNIFQFRVLFPQTLEVEVRPKIENLPELVTKGSEYSEMYGPHEVQNRGLSVNFSNIRPYSHGDSIRHIAWRPSARLGHLVVKEFEKMVNTDATIILNLNPTHHIGYDQLNSWETAKDVTLAITSQLINQGSQIEFIYNYGKVEKSNGKDQFYAISKLLVEHNIFNSADGLHPQNKIYLDDPLFQYHKNINPNTTLIYIGAVNYPFLRDALAFLKMLASEKIEVILVLVNPLSVWEEFRQIDQTLSKPQVTSKINILLTELQSVGIRVCFADMGGELQQNFREKPFLKEESTLNKPSFKNASEPN